MHNSLCTLNVCAPSRVFALLAPELFALCSLPSSSSRLNNCVGRSNYRYFVALLLSTFFMTSIQLGLSVWFIIMFHTDNATFSDRGTVFDVSYPLATDLEFRNVNT